MSYMIVYDRQFLKLLDGRIIPLILCGANNCWEMDGRGNCTRRERYWTAFWENNNVPAYTADELMKKAETCTGGAYQEHFKRNGKWVDDAAFLRFFKNGIKQAKTFKELADEKIYSTAVYASLMIYTEVPGKPNRDTKSDRYLHSDNDVAAFLADAEVRLQQRTETESIYVTLKYCGNDPLPKPKRKREPKQRLITDFYVVTYGSHNYVTRVDKAGLHYCGYVNHAKQFKTGADAQKWIRQRNLDVRFHREFSVEKIV